MQRYLIIILFLKCSIVGIAQVGSNPFEIQSRLDSVYENNPVETSENVFDVQRDDDPIVLQNDTFPSVDQVLEEESSITPPVGDKDPNQSVETTESATNPFDVSHIPIRKSKLKKEADAFTTKKKNNPGKSSEKGSNAFLFWLIFLSGFLIAIVINTQRGAISNISKAITNENMLKLNHREERKGRLGHYIILYISFFINVSIFIYLMMYHMQDQSGWALFLTILAGVAGAYLIKHIFLSVIGNTFPISREVSLYGFTIQTFNLFLGLLLIPFNLIIAFGPENIARPLIYVSLVVIGLLLLLRSFRSVLIASRWVSSSLFHFLLYLCAFEILPILLLIKVIGRFGTV